MTIKPLTAILLAIGTLSALGMMIGWQLLTHGEWRNGPQTKRSWPCWAHWPAVVGFFPGFPELAHAYLSLYVLLNLPAWSIGWAVRRGQCKSRRPALVVWPPFSSCLVRGGASPNWVH